MKRIILSLSLIFSMLASPAIADELVSVKLGYQLLTPTGVFSGDSVGDTVIDMEADLDFEDSNGITAEAALNWGDWRISLGYLPISTSGNGTDITFNGETFSGTVTGEVDANLYDLGVTYYLINVDDLPARVQLGLELGVKVFDGEASVSGEVASVSETETVTGTAPIPTIGARARVSISDFVGVAARAGYMSYSGNDFLDAEAQIEFSPLPMVGIYGGYRVIDVKIDEFDGQLDAKFSGPFLGAFARF